MNVLAPLWTHRALVWALTKRHLAARYRGSLLGFFWSLLTPLALMVVYTLVFSFYMKVSSIEHYSIFVFCGLLPWLWTASALNEGTSAIVSSGHLITKSMFPAQILPVVSVLVTMINFLLALPILAVFMVVSGVPLNLSLSLLPLIILLQGVFLLGIVLGLAALNVQYRDVQHIVANALTFLFFLCPIVYPVSIIPSNFRFTQDFNPFARFTELYHNIIFEGVFPSLAAVGVVSGCAVATLLLGAWVFERHRESFAELL